MRRQMCVPAPLLFVLAVSTALWAQTAPAPTPFVQAPDSPAAAMPAAEQQAPGQPLPTDPSVAPTEAALGVGLYPGVQYITSYDAGQGQRYYLFGTTASFAEVVTYYKTLLKDKGDLVFDEPPVHQFDLGRFREESMAFPPSVTVKDYTWGGMGGFLNPIPGAQPARFRTVVQIVPAPAAARTPPAPRIR